MAPGWTGVGRAGIRCEGKAKDRPAEATTTDFWPQVALLPGWGLVGRGRGLQVGGFTGPSSGKDHACVAMCPRRPGHSCLLMVARGRGRGQEEVTSGFDLFLLLGSSPRSLKARVFASVLGIVTCVERLSLSLLLRPKKGTRGIRQRVTWMLRRFVYSIASRYL